MLGVALGAVVFRVKGVRGEVFALLTLAVTFVIGTIIVNTPIDGGKGVSLAAVPVPQDRADAVVDLLPARARGGHAHAAGRLGHRGSQARRRPVRDPRRRGRGRGDGRADLSLQADRARRSRARWPALAGGIHALFLKYVTVGEVFTITVPLTVVLMSVLGGTRHWAGPAVGAVAITLLLYSFTAADHAVAGKAMIGVILIAAILFMPDGILPRLQRWRASRQRAGRAADVRLAPRGAPRAAVAAAAAGEVLLQVRGLHKAFRGVRALAGVDVEVRRGEILGLLGPNGSGKSTFINVVSGHYAADRGSDRLRRPRARRAARRTASRAPASRAPTRSRARSRT